MLYTGPLICSSGTPRIELPCRRGLERDCPLAEERVRQQLAHERLGTWRGQQARHSRHEVVGVVEPSFVASSSNDRCEGTAAICCNADRGVQSFHGTIAEPVSAMAKNGAAAFFFVTAFTLNDLTKGLANESVLSISGKAYVR